MRFRVVITGSKKIVTRYLECSSKEEAEDLGRKIATDEYIKGLKRIDAIEVDENDNKILRPTGSAKSPKTTKKYELPKPPKSE